MSTPLNPVYLPDDSVSEFLPINIEWPDPENTEEFNTALQQAYRSIADYMNWREIGTYLAVTPSAGVVTNVESLTGQAWFGSSSPTQSNVQRQTYRKVVNFGTLPNAATTSVAHGIPFDANYTMTKIYGVATDPVAFNYLPLPFADPTALANNIALTADGTNVNVITGINRTNFTRAIVVLEYLKNI